MLKQICLILVMFFITGSIYGQSGMMVDPDVLEFHKQNRAGKFGTDEEKLEFIQARFLKEIFLKQIFNQNMSLLTEEDRANSLVPVSDMQFEQD